MIRRIWALSVKDFLHLLHDWWLPAFMLIGGTMELLLVGWATSRPVTNLPLTVIDLDKSESSRTFVTALLNTDTFQFKEETTDMDKVVSDMERAKTYAAVVFPPGFEQEVVSPTGKPTLQAILNGMEITPANAALRAFEGVSRDLGMKLTIQRVGLNPEELEGFDPSMRVLYNPQLSEALYTTPAEMGLMLEFTILIFAALSFSRERELGTLEQLLVMPFSTLEIIIGKALPVILIGFIDFVMMLGIIHFAFKVPIRGSLTLLFLIALLYIFVELGKGMVISVISKTQHQAFLLVMVIGMIDFMFTGYMAPLESMPWIMQFLANFVPAHHWLVILRSILLKDAGIAILLPHILALVILGFFIITFSFRFVRKALNWS